MRGNASFLILVIMSLSPGEYSLRAQHTRMPDRSLLLVGHRVNVHEVGGIFVGKVKRCHNFERVPENEVANLMLIWIAFHRGSWDRAHVRMRGVLWHSEHTVLVTSIISNDKPTPCANWVGRIPIFPKVYSVSLAEKAILIRLRDSGGWLDLSKLWISIHSPGNVNLITSRRVGSPVQVVWYAGSVTRRTITTCLF